jgi:hypothetical protein
VRVRIPVLLAVFVWISALIASTADAAYSPPSSYDCRPRPVNMASPPPKPQLPARAQEAEQRAIAAEGFHPLCPAGEVPYPTGGGDMVKATPPAGRALGAPGTDPQFLRSTQGRGGHRGRGARTSRETWAGKWYSWATGYQQFAATKNVNALWAEQTNEQPYIDYAESLNWAHSLGQIWALGWPADSNCWSTAETGWSESAGQYGDVNPHLFVFAFDCGVGIGEAGGSLPWVQNSLVVFPRAVVSHNDVFHTYGARLDGNNWWIYYDGQWVGYIPHSAWKQYFPSVLKEIQTGGEVATQNYSTCTDMGYGGLYGTHPWAAMFQHVWYEYNWSQNAATAALNKYSSDPSYYNTGHWDLGYPGTLFRYGGPGWC